VPSLQVTVNELSETTIERSFLFQLLVLLISLYTKQMEKNSDKYSFYEKIKLLLTQANFVVNPFREIQYGLQFLVFYNDEDALLRIYENKKGVRLDTSQIKSPMIKEKIQTLLEALLPVEKPKREPSIFEDTDDDISDIPDTDPAELIGIDESGKGDYFGPLCIAAVHTDAKKSIQLKKWGVADSKKLTDSAITELASKIKSLCFHSVVKINNNSYNTLYQQFKNLNHLLAWGHAKSLQSTLDQVHCPYALSDQFGRKSLVENALRSKGIKITLFQRHRAESNIAVAAASILARAEFIYELSLLKKHFNFTFPKGCSQQTVSSAQSFVEFFGMDMLTSVAKLHFVITKKIETS
jgi:ribonuclease HIII